MKEFILLVGPQGSGKTTYCSQRLADHYRISRDDQGEKRHIQLLNEAFENGTEKIVVDKTNPSRKKRELFLRKAKKFGYKTKIVWFNIDNDTCLPRIKARKNHPSLAPEDAEVALSWYYKTFRVPSPLEVDELEVIGDATKYVPIKDICAQLDGKRYLIVGDIHGCLDELLQLLDEREFDLINDVLISIGDVVDRGPKSREALEFCKSLPNFYGIMGNHDDKCIRYFKGAKVKTNYGLDKTIEQFPDGMPTEMLAFMESFSHILKTPVGYLVHAGLDPLLPIEKQQARDCIYMRYYGGDSYFDEEEGQYWFKLWPKETKVFFGHEVNPKGFIPEHTVSLDGGCCFGEYLKAYDSRDGIVHYLSVTNRYAEDER